MIQYMKKMVTALLVMFLVTATSMEAVAQCSVCTRTASQLGAKPARGLNAGILYLAFTPLAIVGFLGYRWWKNNKIPD